MRLVSGLACFRDVAIGRKVWTGLNFVLYSCLHDAMGYLIILLTYISGGILCAFSNEHDSAGVAFGWDCVFGNLVTES